MREIRKSGSVGGGFRKGAVYPTVLLGACLSQSWIFSVENFLSEICIFCQKV